MLKWNNLAASDKDRLVKIYETMGITPAMNAAEMLQVDITPVSLARRIQEYRKIRRNIFREDETVISKALAVLEPTYSVAYPSVTNNHPPGALTDIYHIDMETDQGKWLEALHDLAAGKRYITVMHLADIHFPFENKAALEVVYQLIKHVQPDVIVVGSDAADFALISTFAQDPDLNEETSDVLDEFDEHWTPFIHRVHEAAPLATLVYIWGNHERRIKKFLAERAPKFRKRILRDYVDIVRVGGRVLYLGFVDAVRMGPLVVQHGVRTGPTAAKMQASDGGFQTSIMSGHVHTPSEFELRGQDYRIQ